MGTTPPEFERRPANNPPAAAERYVAYLQATLGCISKAVWSYGPPVRSIGDERTLILPQNEPIRLKTDSGQQVRLFAAQQFVIVPDRDHQDEWRTSTRAYVYHLFDGDSSLIEWHWHPPKPLEPHLHSRVQPDVSAWGARADKLHLPTGRMAFEEIVRFLITNLGVVPRRKDWAAKLDESMEAFIRFRNWSSRPLPTMLAPPTPVAQRAKKTRSTRRG